MRGIVLHLAGGMCVEPATGQVYGRSGFPIGFVDRKSGYVRIGGQMARAGLPQYAHRLMWEAVQGAIPDGMHIDHKNALRSDNRMRNLQMVTPQENYRLATERRRKSGVGSKLTAALVRRIRQTTGRVSGAEWARRLGVNTTTVNQARKGATWRHVRTRRPTSTGRTRGH